MPPPEGIGTPQAEGNPVTTRRPAEKRNDDPSICTGSRHFIARLPKQPAVLFRGRLLLLGLGRRLLGRNFLGRNFLLRHVYSLPSIGSCVLLLRPALPHASMKKFRDIMRWGPSRVAPHRTVEEKRGTKQREGRKKKKRETSRAAPSEKFSLVTGPSRFALGTG